MKVTNNYPAKFQAPFPIKRANINGKLFFKYRQKFRNKTKQYEWFRMLVHTRVENLLINNRPNAFYPTTPLIKLRRHNNDRSS